MPDASKHNHHNWAKGRDDAVEDRKRPKIDDEPYGVKRNQCYYGQPITPRRERIPLPWFSIAFLGIAGHNRIMPNRSRKQKDTQELAKHVLDVATGVVSKAVDSGKDPAAVALGRKGGLKGGKARAAKMTKAQRSASAKKAARARWGKGGD